MFKVWISIEECDDEQGKYEDVGLPDSIGQFTGLDEAQELVRTLLSQHAPEQLQDSDYR